MWKRQCLHSPSWLEGPHYSDFDFQSLVFRGLVSQVQVFKVGEPDVGFKSFVLLEAQGCEFLPRCGSSCQGWGSWPDSVSASPTCLSVGFFSFACERSYTDSFGFFSRGNCSIRSTGSVCPWEDMNSVGRCEFRVLLHQHLEHQSPAATLRRRMWGNQDYEQLSKVLKMDTRVKSTHSAFFLPTSLILLLLQENQAISI